MFNINRLRTLGHWDDDVYSIACICVCLCIILLGTSHYCVCYTKTAVTHICIRIQTVIGVWDKTSLMIFRGQQSMVRCRWRTWAYVFETLARELGFGNSKVKVHRRTRKLHNKQIHTVLYKDIVTFPSNWQHIINIRFLPLSVPRTHMNVYELLQLHSVLQKSVSRLCFSCTEHVKTLS